MTLREIVEDIFAYMRTKNTDEGSGWYSRDASTGGTHGRLISQALDDVIVGDPSTGLDYAMGYRLPLDGA